ncbi:hypothetical protein GmHk_17G049100 [Glycine max]|nr:hypothetical protein GmHk_17G049100 [Glycine max]
MILWILDLNQILDLISRTLEMFTTVNAKDQTYGKVSRSFVIRWKDQLERYWYLIDKNENIYAYCCVQQRFGQSNHCDVPSSMYYFMKEKRFIDLVLEDGSKCRIVYNDWRKTKKIGYGWRVFS